MIKSLDVVSNFLNRFYFIYQVFRSCGSNSPHRFLRQEVTILQLLRHPSLVSMVGVLLRPNRSLVMELAPKGSLRKVLACDHLSRGMQHRIASQVCSFHTSTFVTRDAREGDAGGKRLSCLS